MNFLLQMLPLQCSANLIAYIVQFPTAPRFEPINRVTRAVGESVRYLIRLEVANGAMRLAEGIGKAWDLTGYLGMPP